MPKLNLDQEQVARLRAYANKIANDVQLFINDHSTVSVERAVVRLLGVDGLTSDGIPYPNKVIESLQKKMWLEYGALHIFARAWLVTGKSFQDIAALIIQVASTENVEPSNFLGPKESSPSLSQTGDLSHLTEFENRIWYLGEEEVRKAEKSLVSQIMNKIHKSRQTKENKRGKWPRGPQPWKYLIVATGNIFEDRLQARSAAQNGADIIAVIRTTAQSLLDYIPYGPTKEGFGGTMATQENFRIMREALDEESQKLGRYIMLTNYSSGLCMAEIAVAASLENLDMLLNDSMYGILFRDINMKRTFIDQFFSRLICAQSDIIINTGEDNYLTTADAINDFYTVVSSQLINEAMAKLAGLKPHLLGLGHAFEINPSLPDAFMYEFAHAQLVRDLFPSYPLKYMPPTKFKSTDIFFSHIMDAMFNFTSIFTQQGIHLTGILTEAIHTPLLQDRFQSLSSVNYIFNGAKSLSQELQLNPNGFIAERAKKVLNEVEDFLKKVSDMGLMSAIEKGFFAQIKRPLNSGKGGEGVFRKHKSYSEILIQRLREEPEERNFIPTERNETERDFIPTEGNERERGKK